MIPKECKRLAEVDFPLSAVNEACVEENNRKTRVDSGHLSLLHSWWARRPLSSCRSLLLTLLLPDPCDPRCPAKFKVAARKALQQYRKVGPKDDDVQRVLLSFVADIAKWDTIRMASYTAIARELVKAAYDANIPHVWDPFSGGGSIPLEALRLGCEVTAGELNPVAWLLLKIALEWCGRKGPELSDLFGEWSQWVLREAEKRLSEYYPSDAQRRKPLAYLWARTVQCEAAGCGATIPLVRNLWLSAAKGRKKAIRLCYAKGAMKPRIEVFAPRNGEEDLRGTVVGNNATCPKCHMVTRRERVQAQLRGKRGGADDAILLAVVRGNASGRGKDCDAPTRQDLEAFAEAADRAKPWKSTAGTRR